jgi:high-affinity iron transporter
MSFRATLCWVSSAWVLCAAIAVHAEPKIANAAGSDLERAETLRQVAGILDYIGGDYRGAVSTQGAILNPSEYAEQRALARDALALVAQTGLSPSDPLRGQLDALNQALSSHENPARIELLSRSAREAIEVTHHVDLAPKSAPSRDTAERLFRSQGCNNCHGDDCAAHTPAAAALDPHPANFLDAERMATVSPHRAFHAISFGVPGTAMLAFAALSDAERWSLAFYVLSLRHLNADVSRGQRAFADAHASAPQDARGLSALSEEQLDHDLANISDPQSRADALGYLRVIAPFAQAKGQASLARAYQQLDAGLAAYERGNHDSARRLFISAYLDGVEPHEAVLSARDPELVHELERAMLNLRSVSAAGVSISQLRAAVETARGVLDRAASSRSDANTAFIGAMTIALREGVEIVLLVAALLGLVRKRGQPELARYVHLGWILAIPAGLGTFYAAESLLSGMRRELAEGIASLLAALVLVGVTHWLLGQLSAKRWVGFLASRIGAVVSSRRAALGVLALSFLAAYREAFEIVLFFQALLRDAGADRQRVWLGAALGLGLLCLVALVLLRVGAKLRPAPFMLASGVCLALLSFMLIGKGVHALQEAAVLPAHRLSLPDFELLGLFATGEGYLAQGALLVFLLLSVLLPRRAKQARPHRTASAAE